MTDPRDLPTGAPGSASDPSNPVQSWELPTTAVPLGEPTVAMAQQPEQQPGQPLTQPPTQPMTRREARAAETGAIATTRIPATPDADGATPKSGIGAFFANHRTAWVAAAMAVVFLILGASAIFAGVATGSPADAVVAPTPSASADEARPVPAALPAATRLRTCSVAGLAADPRLANFQGYVARADTGEALFDRGGTVPARTGSVLKVVTAAAALAVLGPNGQLSTKVVDGSAPGTIVLVGGGDPTLSQVSNSFYSGAPRIADLASQAIEAYETKHPGVPITEVILDATMWNPADKWDSSWLRKEQTQGYHSEVTALMVDGDRADPSKSTSPRGTDPITKAGQAFLTAAGLEGAALSTGSAAAGATVLAEVKSQPVSVLIDQMLKSSDNTLAEMLARVTSKALGFDGSSASLAKAIPGALVSYGIDTSGVVIRDGSGLSDLNNVAPEFMNRLFAKIAAGGNNLEVVYNGLPVAGVSGSLAGRFTGANAVARGQVFAKTGWLDAAYSLGGIVRAADGTVLTFTFYAIRDGISANAKEALDTLTTGVYKCGDNLSNN